MSKSMADKSDGHPDIADTERKISIQACNVLNDLRKKGQLCDAVVKCDDGQFPVHRAIMSACSPYFRALFTNGLTETDQREVFIRGVSSDMMDQIIEYAYTRTAVVNSENVERLLPTADQFHVLGLVKECTSFLASQLAFDNCIGIYNFARAFFCQHLIRITHNYILENFCEIATQSNEILGLTMEQLKEILDSDDLNVKNEETVFELVVRWVKHNEFERMQCVQHLLKCIRLGLLSTSYFVDHVKGHPYIKDNDGCRPIVIEALKFLCDLDVSDKEVDLTHPLARPRIPHEVIFAVGGWSGGSPTNVIESYDTRADRWVLVETADTGPRAYHGCATVNSKVYVIGGFDGMDYFNTCRCYDPLEKSWSEVSPMNARRCYVSVTVLNGYIYAMGGFDGQNRQNTAEKYQPAINQWSLIAPMNHQRSDASACSANGQVYICGGFNGHECLSSAEVYSPVTNQWTVIQGMRNRRSGIGVIALDGSVYAVGGFNGITRLNNAERYDPATNSWNAINDMYSPRSNFGIEVIDDMVFAIGGFNGITTIYNVECYDPSADEWYDCTDMSIFRSALSCCVVRGLNIVRNYIQRERQRAETKDRHSRHNPHHSNAAAAAAAQHANVVANAVAAVVNPLQPAPAPLQQIQAAPQQPQAPPPPQLPVQQQLPAPQPQLPAPQPQPQAQQQDPQPMDQDQNNDDNVNNNSHNFVNYNNNSNNNRLQQEHDRNNNGDNCDIQSRCPFISPR